MQKLVLTLGAVAMSFVFNLPAVAADGLCARLLAIEVARLEPVIEKAITRPRIVAETPYLWATLTTDRSQLMVERAQRGHALALTEQLQSDLNRFERAIAVVGVPVTARMISIEAALVEQRTWSAKVARRQATIDATSENLEHLVFEELKPLNSYFADLLNARDRYYALRNESVNAAYLLRQVQLLISSNHHVDPYEASGGHEAAKATRMIDQAVRSLRTLLGLIREFGDEIPVAALEARIEALARSPRDEDQYLEHLRRTDERLRELREYALDAHGRLRARIAEVTELVACRAFRASGPGPTPP